MRYIKAILPYLPFLLLVVYAAWLGTSLRQVREEARAETVIVSETHAGLLSIGTQIEAAASEPILIHTPETYPGELLAPCGLTAQELENGLHDGLKEYANDFILAEQETGVNALFLASVAALESGWGKSDIAQINNNLFGWMGADGYAYFASREDSIKYVSAMLKDLYLTEGGKYFSGYAIENVNVNYNGNPAWPVAVREIMGEIMERSLNCEV